MSPEQQARFALFEDRFDTEMRRTIQDLRQRRRRLPPAAGQGVESPVKGQSPVPLEGDQPSR
ncbi:MAG: hypothetical protein M5R38_14130 [Candidatus Methylomirabilis sp.]|nr:hypothetical protein [Candidatus Methylomirabilis sp.]